MPGERIPSDSTIRDIVSTLERRDRFVANVLDLLRKAEKEQGPAVVRIGITGKGVLPNIRVDAADGTWTRGAFDGVTFKSFADFGQFASTESNWSTKSMTFAEVETLLRELRGFQPRKV